MIQEDYMKYSGSCHCQRVQFTATFTLNEPTMCNCSYCKKRHVVLHIVDELHIQKGKEHLTPYRFNQMKGVQNLQK